MKKKIINGLRSLLKVFVPIVYFRPFFPKDLGMSVLPKRVLFLHPGHIGDVVMATAVIPVIRSAFPDSEIGFAVGSWSLEVVKDHPDISYVHVIDHWRLNRRNGLGLISKIRHFAKTRRKAIREIKKIGYDTALSLYNFDPNLIDVAWAARIPARVALEDSFFSALVTRKISQDNNWFIHQSEKQAKVLDALPIDDYSRKQLRCTLAEDSMDARAEVNALFGGEDARAVRYRIIHIGVAERMREMPPEFWRKIAKRLSPEHKLLFTGRGQRESELIAEIVEGLPNCINACDRLSWAGLVAAIRSAEVLYGVNSSAGHIAAAVGTQSVMAYHGGVGVARWRPAGDKTIVFTNHLECAPCLLPHGCSDMRCKEIDPDDLVNIDL